MLLFAIFHSIHGIHCSLFLKTGIPICLQFPGIPRKQYQVHLMNCHSLNQLPCKSFWIYDFRIRFVRNIIQNSQFTLTCRDNSEKIFMIINLSEQHSLVSNWIAELRHVDLQNDRMRFRRNLERIGEVAAYEISKVLPFEERETQTPLGIANSKIMN